MMAGVEPLVTAVVALFGAGGGAAYLSVRSNNRRADADAGKSEAEAASILIRGSTEVVVLKNGVIDELRAQLTAQAEEIAKLTTLAGEVEELREEAAGLRKEVSALTQELAEVRSERDALAEEKAALTARVQVLEDEVAGLRA